MKLIKLVKFKRKWHNRNLFWFFKKYFGKITKVFKKIKKCKNLNKYLNCNIKINSLKMSQNENFENNRNMHIYNSNENNQNFNSLSNSITDLQNNFINFAVSQALTNPFVINNITNSVISNISKNLFLKSHQKQLLTL